jgi:hypothetical protein
MPGTEIPLVDEPEVLDELTTEDLVDLYELTEKVGARGAGLDRLAALRRKLRAALRCGHVAVFVAIEARDPAPEAVDVHTSTPAEAVTAEELEPIVAEPAPAVG